MKSIEIKTKFNSCNFKLNKLLQSSKIKRRTKEKILEEEEERNAYFNVLKFIHLNLFTNICFWFECC